MFASRSVRSLSYAIAIGVALTLLVALAFVWRRGPVSVLRPLPFTGPYQGQVIDAVDGQPVAGAVIMAEWWCHDNPLPDLPGSYFVRSQATADAAGYFELQRPRWRRGWFSTDLALVVEARTYIDAVFIVDPHGRPLPPDTAAWPFTNTMIHTALPFSLTIELRPAGPVLLEALKSQNPLYRTGAAQGLAEMGPEAAYAVPALIKALGDQEWTVRWHATRALGNIGPAARVAAPALRERLEDDEALIRDSAAEALEKILERH